MAAPDASASSLRRTSDVAGAVVAWRSPEGRDPLDSLQDPAPTRRGLTLAVCTMSRPESLRRLLESAGIQSRRPDQLVVVDASRDDASERVVAAAVAGGGPCESVTYLRVAAPLAGLTRQRNAALRLTERELVAFFDDDIVLDRRCLEEMVAVLEREPGAVGVGGNVLAQPRRSRAALWRLRRLLGVVPTLEPGRYCRTGMSTPWMLPEESDDVVPGDWLPGYAMMWKTALAREIGFDESFEGYAQSEDLDFSLRAARHGGLRMAARARVLHAQAPAGRPDAFRRGYMGIRNRYRVHRSAFPGKSSGFWFAYGWILDTMLLARQVVFPRRWKAVLLEAAGRAKAAYEILAGR